MIAERAGVSRGTVDRVLHNRPSVKPEVRQRILKIMKELNFKPNEAASALAFSRNIRKVGLVMPQWKGFFKEEILRGAAHAEKELNDYGIEILIAECENETPEECINKISELQDKNIVGLCLCAQDHILIREKISELAKIKIPTITYNSDIEDSERICFVGQDLTRSGRIAAEIMSKYILNNDSILVVVGDMKYSAHRKRLEGFMTRLKECAIDSNNVIVVESFNEYDRTFHLVSEALQKYSQIKGIYMSNESVSACVEAVKSLNLDKKPHIICHDLSRSAKTFLRDGDVDFTLAQDIYNQGYLPLIFMKNVLTQADYVIKPYKFTHINIINAENLDY